MPLVPTDPKIVIKSLFSILYFLKKNKSPHFFAPPLRKLRGGAKKWGCLFFYDLVHHENVVYHNFVDFCQYIPTCRSGIRIEIHRIMTHTNEIPQFNGETDLSCVCFTSHRQISSIIGIKCHYCQILCRGSLQTTESVYI